MNFKRLLREFKANLIKNLIFILLISLSITLIVGLNRSMDSYLREIYRFREECNIEDGQFTLYQPLSSSKLKKLANQFDMTIEKYEQVDINLAVHSSDPSITFRVICMEKEINQTELIEGRLPSEPHEIALDPKFSEVHGYAIGDTITLSHIDYQIVGYAISPDYTFGLEKVTDFLANPFTFGLGYVTHLGFKELEDANPLTTLYVYKDPLNHETEFKSYLYDHASLANFISATDNSRITTIINDVKSPKTVALIIGLLLITIIAFMISISIKNTIASESQTIGILYSQGFTKGELLRYYLMLPCLLVIIGIVIGYPLGVISSEPLLYLAAASQYSNPPVIITDTPFIFFTGGFLPLFVAMSITYIALSSALNKTPISLLRGQHASNHVSRFEKLFSFKHFSFFKRFRLKDMIRERASMLSLFFGVFIAMFILLTGFYLRDSVVKYINDLTNYFPYEYMYTFKSPSDLNKYSKHGEQIAFSDFKITINDKLRNVGMYGLSTDSTFFPIDNLNFLKENEVLIAPCMTKKFDIQIGDTITLLDNTNDESYSVYVVGYANYDFGQYFYTSLQNYNYILGYHKLAYTSLLTNHSLDIDLDKVANLASHSSIVTSSENLLSSIAFITGIMIGLGMIVLIIVIYLLMNMILEKSSINISMVKIFGYVPKEINKLYLNGNIFILFLGFIPALPAAYWLCKTFYTLILEEMNQYISVYIQPSSLLISLLLMIVGYLISSFLLKRNINKIALTEALKNRE